MTASDPGAKVPSPLRGKVRPVLSFRGRMAEGMGMKIWLATQVSVSWLPAQLYPAQLYPAQLYMDQEARAR